MAIRISLRIKVKMADDKKMNRHILEKHIILKNY